MTENGFWDYGNLWRNGGDRDFVRYATTEPSPANTECDLCGDDSNNNSSVMADEKNKKPPEDAPEIKMVESNPGRSHSIRFQILIPTNRFSVNEYITNNSNTSKGMLQQKIQVRALCLTTIFYLLNQIIFIERKKTITEIAYKTMTTPVRQEMR